VETMTTNLLNLTDTTSV